MLYEIEKVKSYENEPDRRWFFDHDIDLTVLKQVVTNKTGHKNQAVLSHD